MEDELKEFGISVQRGLVQVRYERSFLFEETTTLNKISKELRKDFPQPQRDQKNGALILVNPQLKSYTAVLAESTSVTFDEFRSFSNFKNMVISGVGNSSRHLDVDEFNRVGMRLFFGRSFDSIEEANLMIKDRFLSALDPSVAKMVGNPNISFNMSEGNMSINIAIYPENSISVDVNGGGSTQSQLNLVVYDIDVFTHDVIKVNQLNGFLKSAKDIAIEKVKMIDGILRG